MTPDNDDFLPSAPHRYVPTLTERVPDAQPSAARPAPAPAGTPAAGAAVMGLVGMNHHGGAGQAMGHAAAIMKTLHARQRAPDGVGVVAMGVEGETGEVRFDTIKAAGVRGAVQPVEGVGGVAHGDLSQKEVETR